jgi:septum site-determining protein MinD
MFKKLGFYRDLDAVIDASQTQLIAVVPFSIDISVIMQRGAAGIEFNSSLAAFDRLAKRIDGQRVSLILN